MNFKELIAGMLSLLVIGASAVAANLDAFPGSLKGSNGQFNAYVVLGSGGSDPAGLASDLAGAVDVAVRLAELQYSKATVSGSVSTSVDGLEKQLAFVDDKVAAAGGDGLAATLQSFHFTGLKRGAVTWKGNTYNYHERVILDTDVADLGVFHNFEYTEVNGTPTLRVSTADPVEYRYQFDQSGIGTMDFTDSLVISLAGKEFILVGSSASGLKALSGNVGTVDATLGVSYSGYTVYALDGASGTTTWAKLQIKDASGNVVATDIVNKGDVRTYTFGSTSFKLKLVDAWASTITNTVSAKVAVGKEVELEYPKVATTDTKYVFPGETDWYIYWKDADSTNNITKDDYVGVIYRPSTIQYLRAGSKLMGPNGYFELAFNGHVGFEKSVNVLVSMVSGKTIYAAAGDTSPDAGGTSLTGFELSGDVSGSLVDGSNQYDKTYVLFNGTFAWRGYWDSVSSKIIRLAAPTQLTGSHNLDFNVSYGGVGDNTLRARFAVVATATDALDFVVSKTDGTDTVTWDFKNKTAINGSATAPTFKLGVGTAAEGADIVVAFAAGNSNIGETDQDVLANTPLLVVGPKTHAAQEHAYFRVPSATVKTKIAFGKIGATSTTTGGTVYSWAGPIVSAVAKLDKDLTAADKAARHLVVVGGPCVNSVAAEVLGLSYPTCGAASTIPENSALIKSVAGKFASGLEAVLVAGWRAEDTRLAASVLQNFDQASVSSKLVGKSSVTVSGTSVATATIV